MTALVAKAMLAREPGASIIYNVICSWTVTEVIRENGGVPGPDARRPLVHQAGDGGDGRDVRRRALGALLLPGELSGGLRADRRRRGARRNCREANVPLSELLAPFRRYAASGEINTKVEGSRTRRSSESPVRSNEGKQDRLDGLTVEFADWWCNVRPSNTEPLLRLNVEAKTDELLQEETAMVLELIRGGGGS